jgi:hypothetical protein
MTDPTPQTRRWVRLRRDNFIKDREHRRMASYVVDFDEGGAPVDWPQRRPVPSGRNPRRKNERAVGLRKESRRAYSTFAGDATI